MEGFGQGHSWPFSTLHIVGMGAFTSSGHQVVLSNKVGLSSILLLEGRFGRARPCGGRRRARSIYGAPDVEELLTQVDT